MPKNRKLADLAGCLGRPPNGKSLSIEEMDEMLGAVIRTDDARITGDLKEKKR